MQACRVECPLGGQVLSLETGKLAKQAHGAVVVQFGDTVTLVTAVEGEADEGRDFFPLVVDYREKTYAAGKFPGGFIKREGRPTTKEILTSRLIDRPIRPLFPSNYFREVQVMGAVLSADRENDPDVLCMIGSSRALHISHIPFLRPTGAIRIGRIDNEFIVLPTHTQMESSDLDLMVAGTRDAITMIEGFAREMSEDNMVQAIMFAHEQIVKIIDLTEELRGKAGLQPKVLPPPRLQPRQGVAARALLSGVPHAQADHRQTGPGRGHPGVARTHLQRIPARGRRPALYAGRRSAAAFEALEERVVRDLHPRRQTHRRPRHQDLRAIVCEVGVLPRTHGSAIFPAAKRRPW